MPSRKNWEETDMDALPYNIMEYVLCKSQFPICKMGIVTACGKVVNTLPSEDRPPGSKLQLTCLAAVGLWESQLTSLCLGFPICDMVIIKGLSLSLRTVWRSN